MVMMKTLPAFLKIATIRFWFLMIFLTMFLGQAQAIEQTFSYLSIFSGSQDLAASAGLLGGGNIVYIIDDLSALEDDESLALSLFDFQEISPGPFTVWPQPFKVLRVATVGHFGFLTTGASCVQLTYCARK